MWYTSKRKNLSSQSNALLTPPFPERLQYTDRASSEFADSEDPKRHGGDEASHDPSFVERAHVRAPLHR